MFLEHFGLIEQPFGVTPDPRFLFMGVKHREALASLVYGTETNRGFLALIAEPGMGKTSLLYQYLEGLRTKARIAFLFQTDCDPQDFLRHILVDLGLNPAGKDLPTLHAMLNEELSREFHAGRRFILVIDEAQNLDERSLESIRLLSNFETPWAKPMQIVIAGQPQLAARLTRPSMVQLRQRISSVIRIEPFTQEETLHYIEHRLWVGGYEGPSLFTPGARLLIAKYSGGIPRNINTLCFNAMSIAYGADSHRVDSKMVQESVHDLDMESLVPSVLWPSRVIVSAQRKPILGTPSVRDAQGSYSPMIYAFAAFCLLMLLGTFTWIGWQRGMHLDPVATLREASASVSDALTDRMDTSQSDGNADAAESNPETVSSVDIPAGDALEYSDSGAGSLNADQDAANTGFREETRTDSALASRSAETIHASVPAGLSQNDRVLTVAIQRRIAVRKICLQYMGRNDDAAMERVRILNPGLESAGYAEPGQRILLPLDLRPDFSENNRADAQATEHSAQQENP